MNNRNMPPLLLMINTKKCNYLKIYFLWTTFAITTLFRILTMSKFRKFKLTGGKFNQIITAIVATLNAISDGMHFAWTSPALPILFSSNSPIKIQESNIVWLENMIMIGGLVGIPLTIYAVDKFGRKATILMATVQSMVAWIMIAFASSVEVLYAARFIAGIAADVAFVSAPMYIAEIADQKIRGFLGSFGYTMMLIGILIVYSVGPYVSILISSLLGVSFLLIQLVTLPLMPESPYFLIMKGREDRARSALQTLRSSTDVETEYQNISSAVKRQLSEKGRFIDLVLIKSNRKAVIIMLILNFSQHFSGFSVILMNLHHIMDDAAPLLGKNLVAILFSALMLVACLIASTLIDKAGRRMLLISSSLLTGFSLLVLSTYFLLKYNSVDVTSYNWVPLASILMYATVFKYGLGMVPIVTTAELFPSSVKAMGMTTADLFYVLGSIASIYLYQILSKLYGNHVPFFIFSICCVFTAIFTLTYIPETKGKTLEEIQMILKGYKMEPSKNAIQNNIKNEKFDVK